MYDVSVYDENGQRVLIVESLESLQWIEYWQKAGEAKIVCGMTSANVREMVKGRTVYVYGMTNTCAEIQGIEFEQKNDGNYKMTVHAPLELIRLDDRVVMATEMVGNIEQGMRDIYTHNQRGLDIALGEQKGFTEAVQSQVTWDSVLRAEIALSERGGYGIRVLFDPLTAQKTFDVYKGVDRTLNNTDNNGIYSDEMQNISKFKYTDKTKGYKNVAVVAGAGEGAERVVVIVSLGSVQGDERREMYVDARDLAKTYDTATETGTDENGNPIYEYAETAYTDEEYTQILQERGIQKLLEQRPELVVSAGFNSETVHYGKDFSLGDVIPLKIEAFDDLIFRARVSSVRFIDEKDGYEIQIGLTNFEIENLNKMEG